MIQNIKILDATRHLRDHAFKTVTSYVRLNAVASGWIAQEGLARLFPQSVIVPVGASVRHTSRFYSRSQSRITTKHGSEVGLINSRDKPCPAHSLGSRR